MNNPDYGEYQAQSSCHNSPALHNYVWPAQFLTTSSYISEGRDLPTSKGGNCNTSKGGNNIKHHHNTTHDLSIIYHAQTSDTT